MAGERNYLRIPPDSTGKRVRIVHNAQLTFNNMVSNYFWKLGRDDYILGDGWNIHIHEVFQETSSTGSLDVSYSKTATYTNLNPTIGTSIKDPDTEQIIAYVTGFQDIYVNASNIVGAANPSHGVNVDESGSLNVRFAEGLPQLDAFGKIRVAGATLLGEYTFVNSTLPDRFASTLTHTGASITWDQYKRAALLSIDDTSGSTAGITTNTYHHYYPGSSHVAMMTLALGDSGKQGLGRGWGLFDDQNGFHFIHKHGRLGVSIKSNVTGTIQDLFFWQDPTTSEIGWNGDKLDGTGDSGMIIDVTKDNLYWLDAQWLGAGRVRFGVYYNGSRIVCHEYQHANTQPYPFSATGSLPLKFMQRNFSATGSSSEMRVFCGAVWTETNIDIVSYGEPGQRSIDVTVPAANNQYYYVATMSPKEVYSSGSVNRTLYFPTNLHILAFDNTTGQPVPVEVEIIVEPVLSGLNFQSTDVGSTVVYDRGIYDTDPVIAAAATSTYYGGGQAIFKAFVQGTEVLDLSKIYNNMVTGSVKNYAESGGFRNGNISSITQGSNTVEITFQEGVPPMRECSFPIELHDITINTGSNSTLNDQSFYTKIVGLNKVEIWQNRNSSLPYASQYSGSVTLDGTHDTNTGIAHGYYGPQFHWTIVAKKLFGSNPARIITKVGWKELRQ